MLEQSAAILQDFITEVMERYSLNEYRDNLKARLLAASGSFRKENGRHELRTSGVYYCAFQIPGFELERTRSQRDAALRISRFGLTKAKVRGATVLDLGANVGAMLLQLSDFSPSSGLGIEFDREKVALAQEIAAYAALPHIRFEQGDIDRLNPDLIGTFDIVLALAIEAHVLDPDRLYWLLGTVTRRILCFEGNAGCDVGSVRAKLLEQGFTSVQYLGFCDDDILPENNRRPLLIAYKHEEAVKVRYRTVRIESSFSYRLGNMLVRAIASPGCNTILLPYRLIRLCYAELVGRKGQRSNG